MSKQTCDHRFITHTTITWATGNGGCGTAAITLYCQYCRVVFTGTVAEIPVPWVTEMVN